VDFLRVIKFPLPEELEHLRAWHARMQARPSAKA
jgi:glutathione S-transferase